MSMLDPLRRLLSLASAEAGSTPPRAIAQWARRRGLAARSVHGGTGTVVDVPGDGGRRGWRLEWGPAQRGYIDGPELRLIAGPALPPRLRMLVGSRSLLEAAERAAYEDCVGSTRTRVDSDIPPEMRWLIVHPRLGPSELGALRSRYLAVSNDPDWLVAWLVPALRDALLARPEGTPLIVTAARGRMTLRTALRAASADDVGAWAALFDAAIAGAGHATGASRTRPGPADGGAATALAHGG